MKFRHMNNLPPRHAYAQGGFRKDMDQYEELIDSKSGKMVLKVTEKIPFDEMIQEHKSDVSLESLLDRYKIDISKQAITEISDDVIDLTIMPQDALECYSMIHEAQVNFDNMPSEFKSEFNNNFGEYLKGFTSGKTKSIVDKFNKKIIDKSTANSTAQATAAANSTAQASATTQIQGGVDYNASI